MLQARPRAWASLLQVLGAQLLQPGTQALLPTVPPAPPPTTTRGTRRRTTVGPTSNCHTQLLTAQFSLSGSQSAKLSIRQQARWLSSPTAAPRWIHLVRTCTAWATGHAERSSEVLHFYAGDLPSSGFPLTITTTHRAHCSLLPDPHLI